MKQYKQQKITKLQKNLADKIRQLKDEIKNLPAYVRRKKDKKNWETFFTIFAFAALIGIVICGTAGWLAVAVSGTLLALIIVESGLFLSLAIGFSAWPVYNIYLWTRDLFSSEKIKSQNKHYDQCQKNLIELKELAAEKQFFATIINCKLNNALQYCRSELSQGNAEFIQLSLKDKIKRLEKEMQNLPAYSRKQKDKENWNKIFQYSAMASCAGIGLYVLITLFFMATPPAILLGPSFLALLMIETIIALIVVGPAALGSFVHAMYLGVRDLFSSAEIREQNKHYAQFEKIITELKQWDEKLNQLDKKIESKLQACVDNNFVAVKDTNEVSLKTNPVKDSQIFSEDKNFNKYGLMFSENFPSVNQAVSKSEAIHTPRFHAI